MPRCHCSSRTRQRVVYGDGYRSARKETRARSKGLCQFCGRRRAVDCHHWALRYPHDSEVTAADLIALCLPCHLLATVVRLADRIGFGSVWFIGLLALGAGPAPAPASTCRNACVDTVTHSFRARLRRDRLDSPPLATVDLKTVVEHCGLTLVAGCLPCSRNVALDADALAARFGWAVPVTEIRRRLRCRRCGNRTLRLLLAFWPDRAERTVCAARARRRAGAVAAQTHPEDATGHEGRATYASAP